MPNPSGAPENTNAAALAGARGAESKATVQNDLDANLTPAEPPRARLAGTLRPHLFAWDRRSHSVERWGGATLDALALAREEATQAGHPDDDWLADLSAGGVPA